jgi:hypothetical protein
VVFNRRLSFGGIRVPERPFAVAHDEQAPDTVVARALLHLAEIRGVLCPVLEKLVHVLDGADVVVLARLHREVEVVELAGKQRLVERPLGKRDLELRAGDERHWKGREGQTGGGGFQEFATRLVHAAPVVRSP